MYSSNAICIAVISVYRADILSNLCPNHKPQIPNLKLYNHTPNPVCGIRSVGTSE